MNTGPLPTLKIDCNIDSLQTDDHLNIKHQKRRSNSFCITKKQQYVAMDYYTAAVLKDLSIISPSQYSAAITGKLVDLLEDSPRESGRCIIRTSNTTDTSEIRSMLKGIGIDDSDYTFEKSNSDEVLFKFNNTYLY